MNPPRLTLIAVVAAVIAAVYTLDIFLERAESSELHAEARGLYAKGGQLLATGHPADAAEVLQRAFTLDRANRRYQLAYAEALVNAGRRETAAALLADVVRHSPNDGKANLLLARLARTDGDFENEGAYYHRAIYGVWDQSAAAQSSAARLEWIRELVARGDRKQLLSELLPLEAEAQDFNVRKQVAQYLLVAGSPARSADLYRALIAGHPEDASLQKGLGQAEAAAGEYASAHHAYLRASHLDPADTSIRHEIELASALSAIDPTPRRLPSREKYGRSLGILRLVRDSVAACGASAETLAEPDRTLALKHPDTSNEAAEQVLQQAESLWRSRPSSCPAPEVLPVLMQKLAQ